MGLSGRAIGKIAEAIKSVFTEREKLVMMLRYQLDMEASDVPNANDYSLVVFDLITKLEKEGRIPDLIKGALNQVPGNSNLQNLPEILIQLIPENDIELRKIRQEINDIVLYGILLNLAAVINNFIRQAKYICSHHFNQKFYEDWDDTTSDTIIADILSKLEKVSQDRESETPVIQFAAYLLERLKQEEIPQPKLEKLVSWVKNNAKDYSTLFNQVRNDNTDRNKSEIIPTYLIVSLTPSQQQSQRYLVSAWFITDGRDNKFNYKTGEGYQLLENQSQQQETFLLAEIPGLLEGYIDQTTQYLNENSSSPTIEIFLPYELLNAPIDTWEIEIDEDFLRPIGIYYNVIVRSINRLSRKYKFRNIWTQKWHNLKDLLKDLPKNKCSQYFVCGEFASCEELLPKINQNDIFALTLIKSPPTKEHFQVINTTGIPVALWFREELNISNSQAEIDQLLECAIAELPEQVKQKRSSDFGSDGATPTCGDRQQRIGHHLSLLWENPYILPPEITYRTP